MSNHFTGLSLGPPLGDQRLDLCDLYAFQSPGDSNRTVIILNANPNADALHPDAIYRVNIDTDGDYLTDLAFSYTFAKPESGRQTFSVHMAKGEESRSPEAVRTEIISDAEVSFGPTPNIVRSGPYTFFAGAAATPSSSTSTGSRIFSTQGASATSPSRISAASLRGPASTRIRRRMYFRPQSSCRRANSIPSPRSMSGGGAAEARRQAHSRRPRRPPSVSSFFNTDDTKEEYNASEPVNDRQRWLEQFIHLMGHTGNYTREEAIAAIDKERTLPDVLSFDPSKPAAYPNGRVYTDDVINYRLAFLTKGECPPPGSSLTPTP